MIIVDSREKKNEHIIKSFERWGIEYDISKLYVGDYMRYDKPLVIIDRKQNVLEVASNISERNGRFKRELERLSSLKGKMYVLIEEPLERLEDVQSWVSPRKKDGTVYCKITGMTIYRTMLAWQHRHNIEFIFCHKNGTAGKIIELLEVKR